MKHKLKINFAKQTGFIPAVTRRAANSGSRSGAQRRRVLTIRSRIGGATSVSLTLNTLAHVADSLPPRARRLLLPFHQLQLHPRMEAVAR